MKKLLVYNLLAVVGFAYSQPSNVLFIGNSYTHMNNLCKMYERLANSKGKSVFADTLAVSGSSLQGHTLRENTYKKMKTRQWDYVFIQGYSRELSRDSTTIAQQTIPYAKLLIDSIKKYNPCIRIYYYMTWGYADGFKDSIPEDSYTLMQERIEKGYRQLSESTGNYPIAPVGMVWKQMRELYPELNLYAPDNAHPSPYGSYLAACTFFTSVYKESSFGGVYPKKVEEPYAEQIQKTAADYVLSYYTKYHLDTLQVPDKATLLLDFGIREKWLSISINNKSEKGDELRWDFGDGRTSNKLNPKHYYTKAGKYTVTLYVKKDCHWHTFKQSVKVSDKEKYANRNLETKGTSNR
jgi:hypothetical protein